MKFKYGDTYVTAESELSDDETQAYVDYLNARYAGMTSLDIVIKGDFAELEFICATGTEREHIPRITVE